MKKIIALLLVAIMAISLVACGGNTDNPGKNDNPSQTDGGGKTPSGTQGGDKPSTPSSGTEGKVDVNIPEGYDKYVNQGAVILYPTDKYQKGFMGGIEGIENEIPWVRLSISGTAFADQKALCEDNHGDSSDYSLSEITVGEHKALKCIYSDTASYFMEVIIDTSFINDPFWASISVKVDAPKSKADLSMFEDETLWEIINSFYFDRSLKYSY